MKPATACALTAAVRQAAWQSILVRDRQPLLTVSDVGASSKLNGSGCACKIPNANTYQLELHGTTTGGCTYRILRYTIAEHIVYTVFDYVRPVRTDRGL